MTQQSMITVFSLAQAEMPTTAGIASKIVRNAGFMVFDTLLLKGIVFTVSREEAQ
jgi:hypothetical protein